MKCPNCGGRLAIIDSRKGLEYVVRERRCSKCRQSFYSVETIIEWTSGNKLLNETKRINKQLSKESKNDRT